MKTKLPTAGSPWYTTSRFQKLALALILGIALAEGVVAIFLKENDFQCHRLHGEEFLAHGEFVNNFHYLPGRVMMNVLLALGPKQLTRGLVYVLALGLLWICYRVWDRLAQDWLPASRAVGRAGAFFAALLLFPYLQRDLDECGLQIYLLFFLTMAGLALSRQRRGTAGFWLATAATYKVTPLLTLPFLLWKRQWRAASWMLVFLLGWACSPVLLVGWEKTLDLHRRWWAETRKSMTVRLAYPFLPDAEEPKPHNLSLYALVARYLETYPDGHPLHLKHPWFAQFGHLDSATAYRTSRFVLLGLGLVLAWRWRRSWNGERLGRELPAEWAAVCALCALMGPLCWKQHLVLVLPCAFLVVRQRLTAARRSAPALAGLFLIAAVGYLSRHFVVGRELSIVLLSYKIDTAAMLLLIGWTLCLRRLEAKWIAEVGHLSSYTAICKSPGFSRDC